MVSEASDADLFVVHEGVKDELVLLDQSLDSGKVVLLAFEREGVIEHLIGLDSQDLLCVNADMALVVNGLVPVALLCIDLLPLLILVISELEGIFIVLHEGVIACLLWR